MQAAVSGNVYDCYAHIPYVHPGHLRNCCMRSVRHERCRVNLPQTPRTPKGECRMRTRGEPPRRWCIWVAKQESEGNLSRDLTRTAASLEPSADGVQGHWLPQNAPQLVLPCNCSNPPELSILTKSAVAEALVCQHSGVQLPCRGGRQSAHQSPGWKGRVLGRTSDQMPGVSEVGVGCRIRVKAPKVLRARRVRATSAKSSRIFAFKDANSTCVSPDINYKRQQRIADR